MQTAFELFEASDKNSFPPSNQKKEEGSLPVNRDGSQDKVRDPIFASSSFSTLVEDEPYESAYSNSQFLHSYHSPSGANFNSNPCNVDL